MQVPKDFLTQITQIIEENLSNEKFGVSDLAAKANMSRSNLLRKIKKLTNQSASRFIRQIRLENAMELLKKESSIVSEIAYEVGFSSVSYFIKCFREQYGYPPGEVGKNELKDEAPLENKTIKKKQKAIWYISGSATVLVMLFFAFFSPFYAETKELEKSVAVLPFINDSDDSTNIHIINGLMESILTNLQKIKDVRVISRTSVEKYRNTAKTIPEIGRELDVSYFIEGSGQKMGDKIMLHVQLIEAKTDKHLWAEQYNRETKDIFELQRDIATKITDQIQVIITPEEAEQISKTPTNNLEAYDNFLKGLDLMNKGNFEGLIQATPYLKKAIELDENFARAYAAMAINYYYQDLFRIEKQYTQEISINADKALIIDPRLPQGLLAKGLYYLHIKDYAEAAPYLEKAHAYMPNSALIITILSDFYTSYVPNTQKYLEYALKGLRVNVAVNDSSSMSFVYLHIANAFVQTGFVGQAEKFIDKSLSYNPNNLFSEYVKAYILYAKNKNLKQTRDLLIQTLNKDSLRPDILQEVGKVCYYLRDYEAASTYFRKFVEIKKAQNLDMYRHINAEIGLVFEKVGFQEEAEFFLKDYKVYAESTNSLYKDLELAMYYSYRGKTDKALHHLQLFSQQKDYHYWTVLFVEIDPLMDNIKDLPEFKRIWREIENKFWEKHEETRGLLVSEGLID